MEKHDSIFRGDTSGIDDFKKEGKNIDLEALKSKTVNIHAIKGIRVSGVKNEWDIDNWMQIDE